MFLKKQNRTLSFLLALMLVLSTFLSVAVFPASAAEGDNYGVKLPDAEEKPFSTLQAAIDYVGQNGNPAGTVITVLGEEGGSLDYTENCTIPSGTTLLIPFDSAHTLLGDDVLTDSGAEACQKTAMNTYVKPTNFMTLNMLRGSSLTVADGGAIYLGGKAFTSALNGGSQLMPGSDLEENRQSVPSGPDGRIHMNNGSRITVGNGGKLYAFGYIYGTDDDIQVEAENGASVYEYFQITGWPGTTAVGSMIAGNEDQRVFPFNQYYIQNIEVPLKINYGASEIVYSTLFNLASSLITFIGDGGMFQIENDGYLIKDYIEATDRLSIESHCDATLGSLAVSIYHRDLSTSSFPYLPLTNNISITVAEGSHIDVAENIAMLPGTELTVAQGATVSVAKEKTVYVLDRADWKPGYAMPGAEIFPVAYATSADIAVYPDLVPSDPIASGMLGDGVPTQRVDVDTVGPALKGKDLQDAEVDINGTAVVYGGFLTVGESGNIHSSVGTGEIKYISDSNYSEINLFSSNTGKPVSKKFTSPAIKTGDDRYVSLERKDEEGNIILAGNYTLNGDGVTKEDVTYYYVEWYNGDESIDYGLYAEGEIPVFTGKAPEEEGEWIGWTTDSDDPEAELIPCGQPFPPVGEENIIYYSVFKSADPIFQKHSLSLNGAIGVNFYVDISSHSEIIDPSKLEMDFAWGNAYVSTNTYSNDPYTKTVATSGNNNDVGLYEFTVPIAAKELNDKITATLKYDGTEIASETYSGTTYAYKLLATDTEALNAVAKNNDGAGLKSLVTAMLNYCSAAQDNFAYNTASHANDGLTEKEKKLTAVNPLKLKDNAIGDLPEGVSYYGGSLNLGSETSYMVIFRHDNQTELNVSATYADTGESLATAVRASGVAVGLNLQNIPAAKVTSDITMTINDGSAYYTATVNTGSYINAVLSGNYSDDLQNVMKALYHYNQAAVKYFG